MFKGKKILILILILASSFFVIANVFAQNIGLTTVDTIAGGSGFQTNEQRAGGLTFLNTTIADIINIFLGLIGVVFIGLMVYSGYQWMTAGGEEENVRIAQGRIRNSAIGLAIVLLAFVGTRTVFTFFYQQAGDRGGSSLTAPLECTGDPDCPDGYECQGITCQPMGEPDGRRCEKNADCPSDQPICEEFANFKDWEGDWYHYLINWVNMEGWSYCTCRKDSDCKMSIPSKPRCAEIPGINKCSVCINNSDCANNSLKKGCDILNGECVNCSDFKTFLSCSQISGCTWKDDGTGENKCFLK